jgi:hypothetical protein
MPHLLGPGLLFHPLPQQVDRITDGLADSQVGNLLPLRERPERSLGNAQGTSSVARSQRKGTIVRRWWRRVN